MTHRINRAHRQFKKAVQHGRASDHDYRWFLQARSLSLQGWGLIDLPLRASNEGSPRPRVARAQETDQAALPHSLEFFHSPLEFLLITLSYITSLITLTL